MNFIWKRDNMKASKGWLATICLSIFNLTLLPAHAEELPLWEAWMGVAYVNFPYYRGSNERKAYVLPVPYLAYRGEFLQVSREHVRSMLFKKDDVELDISVNASVPVKSNDTVARRGMPNLYPTFEIGPSLNFHLIRSQGGKADLDLRLPLRPAWTPKLDQVGWLFQPQLNIDMKDVGGNTGWNLGLVTGLIFADQRYHRYFYDVDPAFATPNRPAYSAHGGYSGGQFIVALSKRFPGFWVGGFAKWDTLYGAVFADSPLVKTRQSYAAGVAISWIFGQSTTMVKADQ